MKNVLLIFVLLFAYNSYYNIIGEEIRYEADGIEMIGYIAYDDEVEGERPGVLVVHEWWGHNSYARKRADMLAELGYVALAVDMYGDGKTADHPSDAGKFAGIVMQNFPSAKKRFEKAIEVLGSNDMCNSEQIAAIGYCFGGGIVLNMARQGVDLKAVASFHGSLGPVTPAEKGNVKAAMLVCNGADDPFVKSEAIEAFKSEMDAAEVDYNFINYPGAVHAFTNPAATENGKKFNIPLAYNEEADKQSWAELVNFLEKVFG